MDEWMVGALVVVAIGLVWLSGANDGGVMLAMPVRFAARSVVWYVLVLVVAIVVVPALWGVAVARTLVDGLFSGSGPGGQAAFLVGVAAALVVVVVLTNLRLPTSLTLALIGGLAGAAVGAGLPMSWGAIGRVLLIGLAAPVVGGLAGWLFNRGAQLISGWRKSQLILVPLATIGFGLMCLAYAANDAQKMTAVAAVTLVALPGGIEILAPGQALPLTVTMAVIAALFVAGMMTMVRKVTIKVGFDLAIVRRVDATSAQLAAAGAVLASSAVGVPVSMSQSLAAAVVGAGVSRGSRRVRWNAVAMIAMAWAITLPASVILAAAVGVLLP